MLKKKFRLRKNIAFSATFRLKNCKSNEVLTLYKGKDKTDDKIPTKVGFVVGKKIHKRAVKRNKIKRRLREIYIEAVKNGTAQKLQDAMSLIFIAKSKILDLSYQEIKQAVEGLIEKF
ncbi:MAG: ribonuclease P protein component [Candidatus Gastranaerophilales bacterium]|nr:ribonuclease P protein component [Candidatus Gastranaerophilales bacterium]